VNLNRSGVPLIEIVSKPDMRSASEAVAYLKKIHQILVFSHVTDGNMEEGNFRCDVNVSVRPIGQDKFGTRTEIKNINSFRFVEKALEYEVARQIAVLQTGGKIIQETRGWDSAAGKSYSLRSKEDAHDYRYFPDPDLPPLVLSSSLIEGIKKDSPELPDTMKNRYIESFGLSEYDAEQLTSDIEWSEFFEKMISEKVLYQDKLKSAEQNTQERFEPIVSFLKANISNDILLIGGKSEEILSVFQKVGSNPKIKDKEILVEPRSAWRTLYLAGLGGIRNREKPAFGGRASIFSADFSELSSLRSLLDNLRTYFREHPEERY
jgi:Glu-tRNA(Gln) amidotransferase subunit E-like FAD-binding protein